jgi:hypothetical protein
MTDNIFFDILNVIFSILLFPPFGMAFLAVLINIVVERVPRWYLQTTVLVVLALLMAAVEPLVGTEILSTLPASLFVQTITLLLTIGIVATSLIPFSLLRERYTRKWQPVYVFGGTSVVVILYLIQGIARLGELHTLGADRLPPAETYLDIVIQHLSIYPWILLYATVIFVIIAVLDMDRRKERSPPSAP